MEGINEIYPRPTSDGISAAEATPTAEGALYTLQGIRIDTDQPLAKGIYVKEGKKFVVR